MIYFAQSYPQGEGENLCRDGRRVWVVSNQAIFNEQGEVVEIFIGGNDTTQRRQAEEAQRSEAKFRAIFENSQVGFRTRFSDELILNANQRLANLLGFDSPERLLEHSIGYFVNPSDRQHAEAESCGMGKCAKHRCENEMGQCFGTFLLLSECRR